MKTSAALFLYVVGAATAVFYPAPAAASTPPVLPGPEFRPGPGRVASSPASFLEDGSAALLSVVPAITGTERPGLVLAQRAIQRSWKGRDPKPEDDPSEYTYVEVEGWKSPARAAALSAALPGAGQWYTGSSKRFLFLGVEAVALYSYFRFRAERDEKRDEAFAYAGDPNDPGSRWSFSELGAEGSTEDVARLREIYAKDQVEFYSTIARDPRYLAGWRGTGSAADDERAGFLSLDEERADAERRSRFGLAAAVANHVVSLVDAVREAKLNNFRISEEMSLRLDARTGRHSRLFAVLTRRFH